MKLNRYLFPRVSGIFPILILSLSSVNAVAQENAPVTSQLIRFSPAEKLSADNAAQILGNRLKLGQGEELRSAYIEKPGNGLQVQRFNEYYNGIPVTHGTYALTSKDGIASFAFGKYYPVASGMSLNPQLDEATAFAMAKAAVPAEQYEWEQGGVMPKATLALMEDLSNGSDGNGVLHLAYAFDIYALQPLNRQMVYVDAQSGKILFTDAILKHIAATGASYYSDTVSFQAQQIGTTFYLHDLTRGTGIYTYNLNHKSPGGGGSTTTSLEDSSSSVFFAKDPSVDAHWGAEIVYDYWKTKQNRLSWNGTNGVLKSYVHYGTNYLNAFWSGADMNYGDGASPYGVFTALDVCAHEIGHGVCASTANLAYTRESGAMNEGFSDIWGAVIEHFGDPHEIDAVAKNPWLIGEELGVVLRSMADPKQYDQPDCYNGALWVCTSGTSCTAGNDNYGVHTNSGVLNHWFYLMTVGGKGVNDLGNAFQLNGLGFDTAAKIAYTTELNLTSTANYANCRTASIAAATALYGACSPQTEAVTRAWYAVGVGTDFTPCVPSISFGGPGSSFTEESGVNQCNASHVVSVPVVLNGPAISGGNAILTASVVGGTAVAGVDYDLSKPSFTFTAGGATTGSVDLTIYDNGVINSSKYVDLTFTLSTGGSTAIKSAIMDTTRVTITDDDRMPDLGGQELHSLMTNDITGDVGSPFSCKNLANHMQYIYLASELKAAGVRPGAPISSLNFFVTAKNSAANSFSAYTIGMMNTAQSSLASGFVSGSFTTVYSGSFSTATGANAFALTTPFTWNGTDNVAVEICYTNTFTAANNDRVQAQASLYNLAAYVTGSTNGCSLTFNPANLAGSRPVILFTQDVPPSPIATTVQDTRSWPVTTSQQVYFSTTGTPKKLIAAILYPSDSLGCVSTTVTVSGNGFVPANSGGAMRSAKEFSVLASNNTSANYDGIFYLTAAEMGSVSAGDTNLRIVQTTSANDFGMLPSNTNIITPNSVVSGTNYYGFRGGFTGFGRFFLLYGKLALAVNGPVSAASELWTGQNPFTDAPVLHWNLSVREAVTIRMYDVTGKLLLERQQVLEAGQHETIVKGNADLVPGTYVLQVVRPGSVFNRQLVKQ